MKRLSLIASLVLAPASAFAGSVAGTGGSTEVTQLMNYAKIYEESITLKNQLDQHMNMVRDMQTNSKSLSTFNWSSLSDDLQRLSAIARQGQAMSYAASNQDSAYRNKYPGYGAYVREQTKSPEQFSDRYDDWSKTNLATITSAMQAAQLQESQFATEDATMHQLETLSQTALGRQQALQVGHQIAGQEVRQLQKLRALMMAQMQMQANYMAKDSNARDVETAEGKKFFDKRKTHTRVGDEQSF